MFSSQNSSTMKEGGFNFESPPNSSSSNHYFDHHHQFLHNSNVGLISSSSNSLSLNPMVNHHNQTGSNFYLFDHPNFNNNNPYGGSSSSSTTNAPDFYDTNYESKPFVERNLNLFLPNLTEINHPQIHQTNLHDQFIKTVPDEVSSCVIPDFNKKSVNRAWKGRRKNNVVKGQWTIEEDRLLSQLVDQYGVRKWSQIAQMLPGRIGKQCRERWHNHLRPDIKKDIWSEEEDKVLIQAHTEIGNKWAEIAKRLPGRTENSIKNHWNATKRRQYSKRKCRTKYPRGTILQDYIKSLNLNTSSSSSSAAVLPAAAAATPDFSLLQLHEENNNHNNNHNRMVNYGPNYDLDNFDDEFDHEKMFEDGFDYSLLNDHNMNYHHNNNGSFEEEEEEEEEDDDDETILAMDFQVKKEMDLVEMINSQAKM